MKRLYNEVIILWQDYMMRVLIDKRLLQVLIWDRLFIQNSIA